MTVPVTPPEAHECVFVEEQEPSGRLVLPPCIVCGITAMDALAEVERERDHARESALGLHWRLEAQQHVNLQLIQERDQAHGELQRLRQTTIGEEADDVAN